MSSVNVMLLSAMSIDVLLLYIEFDRYVLDVFRAHLMFVDVNRFLWFPFNVVKALDCLWCSLMFLFL